MQSSHVFPVSVFSLCLGRLELHSTPVNHLHIMVNVRGTAFQLYVPEQFSYAPYGEYFDVWLSFRQWFQLYRTTKIYIQCRPTTPCNQQLLNLRVTTSTITIAGGNWKFRNACRPKWSHCRVVYYSISTATKQILLLSGDIEPNPGWQGIQDRDSDYLQEFAQGLTI